MQAQNAGLRDDQGNAARNTINHGGLLIHTLPRQEHCTKRLYTRSECTSSTCHRGSVAETLAGKRFLRPYGDAENNPHETRAYKRSVEPFPMRFPGFHLERAYRRLLRPRSTVTADRPENTCRLVFSAPWGTRATLEPPRESSHETRLYTIQMYCCDMHWEYASGNTIYYGVPLSCTTPGNDCFTEHVYTRSKCTSARRPGKRSTKHY